MSKTIRVYIVVAVLAVIGLFVSTKVIDPPMPLVGVLIAAIALIGGVYLLRKESADQQDFFETPDDEPAAPTESPQASTSTATAEPLATWEPTEGLATWTPPEEDDAPAASTTFVEEDEEPLDVLDLEELEHIDEFVEAEAAEQAEPDISIIEEPVVELEPEVEPEPELVGAEAHASVIDEIEDVHSDDDIMKASHATELSVTAPEAADNSELAKLLAKVQSRLAAYE